MAWPPTTHQDVEDEVSIVRLGHRDYFRSGYYSTGHFTGISSSAVAMAAGTAYARPFIVGARRAFDRIGVNVATAATAASGGLIQLALYQPGNGAPGPLVLETAGVSSETVGAKEFTITQTLDPGVWWLAARPYVAGCSVTGLSSGEHSSPYFSGLTVPPTSNATQAGWYATTATSTAGAPVHTAFTTASAAFPLVSLRAA